MRAAIQTTRRIVSAYDRLRLNRELILLAIIILFSALIRLHGLDAQSLDCEEFYTVAASTGHHYRFQSDFQQIDSPKPIEEYRSLITPVSENGLLEVTSVLERNVHLPLYFYFMHYWIKVFGSNEVALRFPSVIFGCLAMLVIFLLGKELFNSFVGVMGALFIALMPDQIYYSQQARMYSLLCLLAIASTYAMVLAQKHPFNAWPYIAYFLLSVAGLYTHYIYMFCFAFQLTFIYVEVFRKKQNMRAWVITQAAVIAAFAPWAAIAIVQKAGASSTLGWVQGELDTGTILRHLISKTTELISVPDARFGILSIVTAWGFLLLGVTSLSSPKGSPLLLLCLWVVIPTAGILLMDQVFKTQAVTVPRYRLIIAPAIFILIAVGIQTVRARLLQVAAVLVIVAFLSAYAIATASGQFRRKPDEYMKLAQFVDKHIADTSREIVLTEGTVALPLALAYYTRSDIRVWPVNVTLNRPDEQNLYLSIDNAPVVWVLASEQSHAQRLLQQVGFNVAGSPQRFGHIVVSKYVRQR